MLPAYANFLFNIGLLDEMQRDFFAKQSNTAVTLIKEKQYLKALQVIYVSPDEFKLPLDQ